ncbi:phosphoadenylyl-sulfate reductase [Rufibacter latericius]|uniref:Adenosine 5'-phosphosulfate reductase n=1 Tax=Rufibacter latericius TaxID=2487040 RepID=A0A3M9N132_9BACT|nr:phosphoadenylyl-sulfate reductase [Rufibacter latericius]RNI31501.1 phosphoadenylyl-sulfate reductase [Rufibacter latericius]
MASSTQEQVSQLIQETEGLTIDQTFALLVNRFPNEVTFSSSFSFEDQVISHQILENQFPISIFTLDTGRLFPETYSVWSRTNEAYNTRIKPYYPNNEQLEEFVSSTGPNSFYESTQNRKDCCHIRKVEPLKRALKGNAVWITGLRAEHSPGRGDLPKFEWDEGNKLIKFHPLLYWTTDEVMAFIKQNNIPYNKLHDKGFISIGCAPCTRAIQPGEDFRAGRWWWEDASKKECGLHVTEQEPGVANSLAKIV